MPIPAGPYPKWLGPHKAACYLDSVLQSISTHPARQKATIAKKSKGIWPEFLKPTLKSGLSIPDGAQPSRTKRLLKGFIVVFHIGSIAGYGIWPNFEVHLVLKDSKATAFLSSKGVAVQPTSWGRGSRPSSWASPLSPLEERFLQDNSGFSTGSQREDRKIISTCPWI